MTERDAFPYPLVTTEWLAAHLYSPDLKIVDASWRMPGNPPARIDHQRRRIPGAAFFDLDQIADRLRGLPHMLPSSEEFTAAVGAMGISATDRVIIYDDSGLFSAARVWWTFRQMGHDKVSVLDGGLPKWLRENRPIMADGDLPSAVAYAAVPMRDLARSSEDVRLFLKKGEVVLDARPAARFSGELAEPRAGLRSGHMPGAVNLPFSMLLTETGELRDVHELARLFRDRGVHMGTPVITSCGSGVTAAILSLALERLGHRAHGLYDGSWTEWGDAKNDPRRFPVATG